jgi:hypothetical protein
MVRLRFVKGSDDDADSIRYLAGPPSLHGSAWPGALGGCRGAELPRRPHRSGRRSRRAVGSAEADDPAGQHEPKARTHPLLVMDTATRGSARVRATAVARLRATPRHRHRRDCVSDVANPREWLCGSRGERRADRQLPGLLGWTDDDRHIPSGARDRRARWPKTRMPGHSACASRHGLGRCQMDDRQSRRRRDRLGRDVLRLN